MLDRQWLATFAPVGLIPGPDQWQPTGAGVFVACHDVVWLVTARHVLPTDGTHFGVLVTMNGSPKIVDLTDIMANLSGVEWILSADHDLASAPLPTPTDGSMEIKAIAENQTLSIENVLPSMPSLTGGCPYGLPGTDPNRHTPIVLDGVIAGTDPQSRTLFISTPTFPGSSGGPIIVVRAPYNPAGGMVVGQQTVFLAGIVSQVQTIQPASESKAGPLRLGVGVSVDAIFELLNGREALATIGRIKQANEHTAE